MANEKISGMSAAAALTGTELVEVVQGGDNVKTTTQDIADLGAGGGISGVAPVGNVPKVKSPVGGGGEILNLETSSISDNGSTTQISYVSDSPRVINLILNEATDADATTRLKFQNEAGVIHQLLATASDGTTDGTIKLEEDLIELKVSNTGGADINSLTIDTTSINLTGAVFMTGRTLAKGGSYSSGLLDIDPINFIAKLGDFNGDVNQTYISVDDSAELLTINAANGIVINGQTAYTGDFDLATVGTQSLSFVNGIFVGLI